MSMPAFSPVKKAKWRASKSFWITAAIWLVLLPLFLLTGSSGFFVWLVLLAIFAVLSTLYSLAFGRPSWLGLPSRKGAGIGVGSAFVILVLGFVGVGVNAPPTVKAPSSFVDAKLAAPASALPSPTVGAGDKCDFEGQENTGLKLVCVKDDASNLIWMTASSAKTLLASRTEASAKASVEAEATKQAEVVAAAKKEADDAAAAKVAADQAAAKTASDKVAADQAVAEKAAVDKAVAAKAAEQAAQPAPAPLVQAPQVQAPPANVYYKNCDAVRAAGAAPLYANQPGYRLKLDSNKNGVACE